jgi:hypothetical protein
MTRHSCLYPFVPAKAGTQSYTFSFVSLILDSRVRGNERRLS